MITPPTAPSPGKPVSAGFFSRLISWVKSGQLVEGQGYRLHRTPNGTTLEIEPGRDRKTAAALHPWKVFAFAKSEDRDSCFEIYVPETALHVGEDLLEVEDLTPVEDQDDRYTLDCESEISGSAVIYLAIVKNEPEEGEEAQWEAHVVSTLESIEDAVEVLVVLPIAKLSIDDSGEYEVGKVDAQYAHSSVAFENPDDDEEERKTPAPFDYEVTETEDPETHETTKSIGVANRHFYWDGELKEADVKDELLREGSGTLYLCCTKPAPSSSGEQPWEFEVSDEEAEEPSGGKVLNFKLYDISAYAVTMDYRTTFLSLNSGDAEKTVLPFDGKAVKNDSGQWVVSMEPGQVIGAGDSGVRTVNLTGPASKGSTVTLYVIESSSGSQRFVSAAQAPAVSTGERIAMQITLFRIANDGVVTQYTRGRIDLNGALIVGEAGPIGGGDKSALSGKVEAKGESGSGLIVRSYADTESIGNRGTMAVDIKDRQTSDAFAIREVKNSENETVAKFLGTAGFKLGDMPDLDVLQDLTFDYSVGEHKLTVTKTTVNLKTKTPTVGQPVEIFTAAAHYQNENPVAMTGAQFEP